MIPNFSVAMNFGLGDNQINQFVNSNKSLFYVKYKSQKWLITDRQMNDCIDVLLNFIQSSNDDYDIGFSKSLILQHTKSNEKFLDFLLDKLDKSNNIYKKNEKWIIKGKKIQLSDVDEELKNNIIQILNKECFSTSNLEELSNKTNCKEENVKKILKMLESDNKIIRLGQILLFSIES